MDFSWTEEQSAIRELAREILEAEAPTDRVKASERSDAWLDDALYKALAEANLLGIAIPEAHGGMGMGYLELCVLLEEVGRVVAPGPWLSTLVSSALPIAEFGTDAQRAAWLPRIASGDVQLSAALQDAGSAELSLPATTATKAGDGYTLDGEKRFVPLARTSAVLLVPAATDDGVGIFFVEPGASGVSIDTDRISTGEPLSTVRLAGVTVGADARLGGEAGDGRAILEWLEPRLLAAIAALQVGVSERALRITADYVTEREQFGVPIGSFQAVQHRSADGFIDVEALRWVTWRAVCRLAIGGGDLRDALVAKVWAANAGSRIANSGLHLHGGLGSDVDYPIHRYFLWSKSLELAYGGEGASLAKLGADLAANGPRLEAV